MSIGEFRRRQVRVGRERIRLSPLEHRLAVILLANHPEHYIGSLEIMEHLWDVERIPEWWSKTISSMAYHLRRKGVPLEGRRAGGGGYRIPNRGRVAA